MILVAAVVVALLTTSVSAQVSPTGTGEPAFTRSAQNTQWVEWPAVSGRCVRIRASYLRDTVQVADRTYDIAASASNYWLNWSGVATLEHGRSYGICVQGQYWLPNDSLFFGRTEFVRGGHQRRQAHEHHDRPVKPAASVQVASGATAVRNTLIPVHLAYQDDTSPPFPANFLCVAPGADATAACGTAIFGYTPACSAPAAANKSTSFDCQVETSGVNPPDGPLFVCAIAADSSIPDNPTSSDQAVRLIRPTCPRRYATRRDGPHTPSATINAAAATVAVGQSVAFTARRQTPPRA